MKTLVVILGPTAVGKTALSLQLAEMLHSPIINADSRQIYDGIPIGTATPTAEERRRAIHYFVAIFPIEAYYSAANYEADATRLITSKFATHDALILSGGSMLYIDAVCNGIDNLPTVRDDIRTTLQRRLQDEGLAPLYAELSRLDPVWAARVDASNPRRVVHALEICLQTGRPYSSFLTAKRAVRPFRILKIGLELPREVLYERISRRVDQMMADGLLDEARRVYPFRHLNALNTVGYKELFEHFDGLTSLDEAIERIKRNTRIYARKQSTWFRRDPSVVWFSPIHTDAICSFVADQVAHNAAISDEEAAI